MLWSMQNACHSPTLSEGRPERDYLGMPLTAPEPRADAIEPATADDKSTQDDLYASAIAEFGASLARLAAAYELDRGLRQDLLQDLHVALWRSFATFKGQCSLRTWVYRVAHNAASSYVRRHKRFSREVLMSLEQLEEVPDPSDSDRLHDEAEVIDKLGTLIRRLKPIDREVILLYLEGMDAASIGDVLGISPGNVAQRIHRTKDLLERHFRIGD
jgi:RNA polymerase sigma-70 factor (ECF subfamily)